MLSVLVLTKRDATGDHDAAVPNELISLFARDGEPISCNVRCYFCVAMVNKKTLMQSIKYAAKIV